MIISYITAIIMAMACGYMVFAAKMPGTKKVAIVPAMSCAVELWIADVIAPAEYPMLTVLLVLLRAALLGTCVYAMRRDAAAVRAKARRRERLKRELFVALNPIHEIPAGGRRTVTRQIHIA